MAIQDTHSLGVLSPRPSIHGRRKVGVWDSRFPFNSAGPVQKLNEVFTVPREFLESVLAARAAARPRLLSPYREHLSQAFARYFMRVGLPVPVIEAW
jgi:hypothetical protein